MIADIMEHSDAPVLFGEDKVPQHGSPAFNRWKKNLLNKIKNLIGEPILFSQKVQRDLSDDAEDKGTDKARKKPVKVPLPKGITVEENENGYADRVWILAASLGGPAAVKEFLEYLPDGLPVAFVLAQHIDGGFQKVLSQVLERNTNYKVVTDCDNQRVNAGSIYVLSVEHSVTFSEAGTIIPSDEPWEGPYSPSINQVIEAVAERWRGQSGVIVFSGMGEDGNKTVHIMHEYGGLVLAQDQESSANSSMPDAIRETGCVAFNGNPQQLAYQFVDMLRKQMAVAS